LRLSLLVSSGHFPGATSGMASKASAHGLVQLLNTTAAAPTAPSSTTLRATSTLHQSNLKRLKQQQAPRIGLTPKHMVKNRERIPQRNTKPLERFATQEHIHKPAPTKSRQSKKRPTTALCVTSHVPTLLLRKSTITHLDVSGGQQKDVALGASPAEKV
jgi:hypothetical protein